MKSYAGPVLHHPQSSDSSAIAYQKIHSRVDILGYGHHQVAEETACTIKFTVKNRLLRPPKIHKIFTCIFSAHCRHVYLNENKKTPRENKAP